MPRQKNYTFTLNNYTDKDIEDLHSFRETFCHYMAYSKETGDSGTPHLQGYFKLKRESSMKSIKATHLSRAHLEVMRGTDLENQAYINKENPAETWGQIEVVTPDLNQVMAALIPLHKEEFGPYASLMGTIFLKTHKRHLLHYICKNFPIQYIRHKMGIERYIEDYYQYYEHIQIDGKWYLKDTFSPPPLSPS